MRRAFVVLAAVVLGLLVGTGCTSAPREASEPTTPQLQVESVRPLAAGESVSMRNGLTFTVPHAWEGSITVYMRNGAAAGGPFGDAAVSEYVVLRRSGSEPDDDLLVGERELNTVRLVSRYQASSALPQQVTSRKQVLLSPFVRVWASTSKSGLRQHRPFVAETRVPDAEQGVLYFVGDQADPRRATQRVWDLIKLDGATVPEDS